MPIDYEVQQGDCVGSIAFANGFNWETIWNHPQNAALKKKRKDPNVLFPGDVVHIPDLRIREETRSTEHLHWFKLKGGPARLCIQLLEAGKDDEDEINPRGDDISHYEDPDFDPKPKKDKPRTNVPYLLVIDDHVTRGKSNGNGFVEIALSPGARLGRLTLNPGTPREETYPFQLGGLDPVDEVNGIKQRLSNLGIPCGNGADQTNELEIALSTFQQNSGLTITGTLDDDTRQKLKAKHGG